MTKQQYLDSVERAYKAQGQVTSITGLYLTEPFAGSEEAAVLATEIREKSLELEEMFRELYRLEQEVDRP